MTNAEARFNKIHIRKVYACLVVTCHLHFWQNDRDFLRATVVTRGWNGYRNKSQHRKSTLESSTAESDTVHIYQDTRSDVEGQPVAFFFVFLLLYTQALGPKWRG